MLRSCLHRLARAETVDATDDELLSRFITTRDEQAFAALVERHGPLVLQVCWRVLRDANDTEDAFQAVFLVLARKAVAVARKGALAAWLHGVARRVALKARTARLAAATQHGKRKWRAKPLALIKRDGRKRRRLAVRIPSAGQPALQQESRKRWAEAALRKRVSRSGSAAKCAGRNFSATGWPRVRSSARYTSPMPPLPSAATMR
jgi:DNA-directed RNA polymerase specialized sigma24 family protein